MFSTASFIRLAFSRIRPPRHAFRNAVRLVNTGPTYSIKKLRYYIVPTLGFSLFTWIGFDKDSNPEEDLIMTIKRSILLIQRSEYVKAEQLLHIALRQAQQMLNEMGVTYIYDVMANLALQREQLDKSKKLFVSVAQRLMQNGVKEDDIRIIHISLKLARISHLSNDHNVAKVGYEWCMQKLNEKYKREPDEDLNKLLALAEDWYGRLYIDCNESEKGLDMLLSSHRRSLNVSEFGDDHVVIQLNDIATVCMQLDRIDESESYLLQAVEKGKNLDMEDLGAIYVNLGRVYLRKGMLAEARKSCGYGWRLGHDRKNEDVKTEATKCIDEINKSPPKNV